MRTLILFSCLLLAPCAAAAQPGQRDSPDDPPDATGEPAATEEEGARDPAAEDETSAEVPPPPLALPAPTLDDPPPIAPDEPLPSDPDPQPEILTHIGTGDHSEPEELPADIAFEVPGDARSTNSTPEHRPGLELRDQEPDEPLPPFLLSATAGFARFLGPSTLDFVRIEEHFEWTIPEFPVLRIGVGASQSLSGDRYVVGGGARIGMGVPFCHERRLTCEGAVFVQPGFLAGLTGLVFDLNASLTLRLVIGSAFVIEANGGYSFLGAGSLLHVTGGLGVVF